jgi:AcrR family transcriptional regulator
MAIPFVWSVVWLGTMRNARPVSTIRNARPGCLFGLRLIEVPMDRPLRADARRNRARVLQAAEEAFATEGISVPLDEIARRAGVGAGTVYRHFPTKEALFEAVVAEHLDALSAEAERLLDAPDPDAAFYGFFATLVTASRRKKDISEALLGAGVDFQPATRQASATHHARMADLLRRAQEAGAVREDIAPEDLHALVLGALTAEHHRNDTGRPHRMTTLISDALRP